MTDIVEYLQKPSSRSSIDVSHILSKEFGSIYNFDCLEPEIIENLKITKGSTDPSHQKFVSDLVEITSERDKLFLQTKALEDHLNDALSKAIEDDKANEERNRDFAYLNLPKDESTFFNYIDDDLLRQNGLISPKDILVNVSTSRLNDDASITDVNDVIFKEIPLEDKPTKLPPLPSSAKGANKKKASNISDLGLASERAENQFQLDLLNSKTNYLRNPRFIDGKSNSTKTGKPKLALLDNTINELKSDSIETGYFMAEPEVVVFKEFEVGKVFEKFISFRNVTRVLQPIRVLPPKTRYFSLSLGQFPGAQGLVAPGMTCQYSIRFSPDMVCDFEDELIVETQSGNKQVIRIVGQRDRPVLSGSSVWDMGHSLIYGWKVRHYRIKNIGGAGKFWIIPHESWPSANYKTLFSASNSAQLQMGPFIIRPNYFELKKNETTTFELIFYPSNLETEEKKFNVICDNSHMQQFSIKGTGELASVTLVDVEDGISIPGMDDMTDVSAEILLKFGDLNPYTYYQKKITIRNNCHLDVPFCWKIIKPDLKLQFHESKNKEKADGEQETTKENEISGERNSEDIPKSRTLDLESGFIIEPNVGVFEPMETKTFVITFAPMQVKVHHSVLHLILQGIPDMIQEFNRSPPSSSSQKPMVTEDSPSQSADTKPAVSTKQPQPIVALIEVTCLEIEVKGECIPLDVRLATPSLIVAGSLLINTPVRRDIQIINESMRSVNIAWFNTKKLEEDTQDQEMSSSDGCLIEVEPQYESINPGVTSLDVCIVGNKPGCTRQSLWCKVENMEELLELVVEVKFHGPQLELMRDGVSGSSTKVDFGLVRVGQVKMQKICLANNSAIYSNWSARLCDAKGDLKLLEEIVISPKSGTLNPLQNLELNVQLMSFEVKDIDCEIEIGVENGNSRSVSVSGRVQRPEVVISSSLLDISGQQFVSVPTEYRVKLKNLSLLETTFFWDPVTGENSQYVTVTYEQRSGVLRAKEETEVIISVTCTEEKMYGDLFLPCKIIDVPNPIVVEIKGECKPPQLSCRVMADGDEKFVEDELEINFGDKIEIFKDESRYLVLENVTSIPTNYQITIPNFPSTAINNKVTQSQNSSQTKTRPNLADRQSKPDYLAHYDLCKSHLKHKTGFAIACKPFQGILNGFESIRIKVTAFNDLWGTYKDSIVITGETQLGRTIETLEIPVRANVIGVPLEFTMNAGRKQYQPILRLGSKPIGHEPISRQVRINNKSPAEIFIDWQMYNAKIDESNDKLIDLIINVGDPFPVPDEQHPKWAMIGTDRSTCRDTITETELLTATDRFTTNQDNTVSVVTRPYQGEQVTHPLSFDPPQLLIGPESYEFVTVTFDPNLDLVDHLPKQDNNETEREPDSNDLTMQAKFQSNGDNENIWDNNNGIDYHFFMLGFLSLRSKYLTSMDFKGDWTIERKHQFEVDQLRLDVTARILKPSLDIDFPESDETEEICFSVPYSDLINQPLQPKQLCLQEQLAVTSKVILTNNKDTDVDLFLSTNLPFELTGRVAEMKQPIKLGIGDSMKVDIKFLANKNTVNLLRDSSLVKPDDSHPIRLFETQMTNENPRQSRSIQFRDVIRVSYPTNKNEQSNETNRDNNKSLDQLIPLRGLIHFPEFLTNKQEIKFDWCLVGEERSEHLRLVNRSGSLSVVYLKIKPSSDVFSLSTDNCVVPCKPFITEENQQSIVVTFAPKKAQFYSATIRIYGKMGEKTMEVSLSGNGSYDNQYKPLL